MSKRLALALLAILLPAHGVDAQNAGRLSLTVLGAAGAPVAGANVRLTCPELPRFALERTTDTKGRVLLTFPDALKTYRLHIEQSGFQPVDIDVEAVPGETLRRQIQLAASAPAAPVPSAPTAPRRHNEGVEALGKGDVAGAIARFEAALELDPKFVPALHGLAHAKLRAGDAAAAAAAAERASTIDPQDVRALGLRLAAYQALGEKEKEAAVLKALEKADPRAVAARLVETGVELFDAGAVDKAAEVLRRAVELDPQNAQAHYRLGVCYVSGGKSAEARQHLRRFIDLAPDDPSAPNAEEMLRYLN